MIQRSWHFLLPLYLLLASMVSGCDAFLVDNERNCVLRPAACSATERCSLVTRGCVQLERVAKRPSKSGTIALSDDDSRVVLVNPEEGTLAVFRTDNLARVSSTRTGAEPRAVVLAPDGLTAYVANAADATIVRVKGLEGPSPQVSAPLQVGAEPMGLALSPSGALLFVAEWAEGRVAVVDTQFMKIIHVLEKVRNPRAISVTNNGDMRDADEVLVVPEFFGQPVNAGETSDGGRKGLVRLYGVGTLAPLGTVALAPLLPTETGFGAGAAPNQLHSVATQDGRAYLTSISASPSGMPQPERTVQPVVYVVDLKNQVEVRGGSGTTNLAAKVQLSVPIGERQFLADLVDIDFVPGKAGVAYAVSRGADVIQRVVFDQSRGDVTIGSTMNKQIDLNSTDEKKACRAPIGIAVRSSSQAFVNCWLSRSLGVLDFDSQRLATTVPAADLPENSLARGRRAFYSARGRFSQDSWSSCSSCHPDGRSDNITWQFPMGPRQTPSLEGSFSHVAAPMAPTPRILGWTGNYDEVHDFEQVLRTFSGGKGGLTSAAPGMCNDFSKESPIPLTGDSLDMAAREQQLVVPTCVRVWDDIEAYIQSIRPVRGRVFVNPESAKAGKIIFESRGQCGKCHGGPLWSVSKLFYSPTTMAIQQIKKVPFVKPSLWPQGYTQHNTTQIDKQPPVADSAAAAPPQQVACAIRNVNTFGPDGLEVRIDGTRAQGRGGYSVPSLYGLSVSAPFLHHGAATSLEELFADTRFTGHTQAGSANFLTDETSESDRRSLIDFLLSLDQSTPESPVPQGFAEGCRTN